MEVCKLKIKKPTTIYENDSIKKCVSVMSEKNRGLLVVLNNQTDKNPVGVISNKDIINKVLSKKRPLDETKVEEIMTKDPIKVSPNKLTSDVMFLMRENKVKRVLVVENDQLIGVVSSNDLLDCMIEYKKELLDLAINF